MVKLNRRALLKLGTGVLVSALGSPFIFAQSTKSSSSIASEAGVTKVDGNISYNAGWVVPLEDKSGLLELEARKTKEREELSKQKSVSGVDPEASAKENPKSFSKRIQDIFGKVKNLF